MDDQAAGKVEAFIHRWRGATGSELANYQLFLGELVELLDLPRPDPAREDTRDNAYVFERRIVFKHGDGSESAGRIDLYRRAHFVCEAKKVKLTVATKGFDDALQLAIEASAPKPERLGVVKAQVLEVVQRERAGLLDGLTDAVQGEQ